MKQRIQIAIPCLQFLLLTLLACGGCITVGPDYTPPETAVPESWITPISTNQVDATSITNSTYTLDRWWKAFNDPLLSDLIEQARLFNRDVHQAEARLRQARAQRNMTQAERKPTVNFNGSANRSRSSEQTAGGNTSTHYANDFDATWEADLFGAKKRSIEAAQATFEASREDLRDVLISLFSEVAINYVDYRTYQRRLAITQTNLISQTETYKIACWRQQANLVTQLDIDQAKMSLAQTQSELPSLRTGMDASEHQLDLLLGQAPGSLRSLRESRDAEIPVVADSIAIGVPADVLRQRPDIRKAERALAAQTAQIGVAEAARYPDLSLSGSVGLEALLLGDLYTAAARTASGSAKAAWTLFDGGQLRKKVKIETAYQEELLSAYEATVLRALQEVEDALTAYANEQQRNRSLEEAVTAGQSAFNLAHNQYSSGLVDFETVLSTQQALLSTQDSLASSDAALTTEMIRLYKALGGGWEQDNDLNSDIEKKDDKNVQ